MRWKLWVSCCAALLAAGAVFFCVRGREEARAGTASDFGKASNDDLVKYVQEPGPGNLKLVALGALLKKSGSTNDLVSIAKGRDLVMAVYAATSLGKQKTSDSKTALKDLVTNGKLGVEVRKAAMSALAVHWKSTDDLEWLENEIGSDTDLGNHLDWLEDHVYGR